MDDQFHRLLDAFRLVDRGPPSDMAAFLRAQPDVGVLPSPWQTWTLICLVRHRKRQLWVAEIVRTRLQGDPCELAKFGASGHPEELEASGTVPGLPEWEYEFHGTGCCLTHKVNGDSIDVDFRDDSAEYFDTFFFVKYIESLKFPEYPEQRLRDLHRSSDPLVLAIDDLVAADALAPVTQYGGHPGCLAADVLASSELFNSFCHAWTTSDDPLWLAALVGDWLAVHELSAGVVEIEQIAATRANRCRQLRRDRLVAEIGLDSRYALRGLNDLGMADEFVEAIFETSSSKLAGAALEIAVQQDDPRWCAHIHALFSRADADEPIRDPHIWVSSMTFLLRHQFQTDELVAALPKADGIAIDEAVLLSLEHAPQHTLPLIRKGIFSGTPCIRFSVAAILALIDKPWSRRELLSALEKSDDLELTADARAAILELQDVDANQALLAWETSNPRENEVSHHIEINGRLQPIDSMREVTLSNCGYFVRSAMDSLRERVKPVKDVVPHGVAEQIS